MRPGVRATFFIQGRLGDALPAMRPADRPRRPPGRKPLPPPRADGLLTDAGIARDVHKAEEASSSTRASIPRPWFRCPFGDGHDDPRVLAALERAGYRNHHWDVEPDDWRPERTPADWSGWSSTARSPHGDGAVVLLHSWPPATIAALPAILEGLRGGGASLVGLDEVAA